MEEKKKKSPVGKIILWIVILFFVGLLVRTALGVWGWAELLFSGGYASFSSTTDTYTLTDCEQTQIDENTASLIVTFPNGVKDRYDITTDHNLVYSDGTMTAECIYIEVMSQNGYMGTAYYFYDTRYLSEQQRWDIDRTIEREVFNMEPNEFRDSVRFKSFEEFLMLLAPIGIVLSNLPLILFIVLIVRLVKKAKTGTRTEIRRGDGINTPFIAIGDPDNPDHWRVSETQRRGNVTYRPRPDVPVPEPREDISDSYSSTETNADYTQTTADYSSASPDTTLTDAERDLLRHYDSGSQPSEDTGKKIHYRYEFDEEGNLKKIPYTD